MAANQQLVSTAFRHEQRLLYRPGEGPVTEVRSTLIQSSLLALRARNLGERYAQKLDPRYHEVIFNTLVPMWLPSTVAIAHYEACDALALSEEDQIAMGQAVSQRLQGVFLRTLSMSGKNLGATPWALLNNLGRIWDRTYQGGGYALYKLGPKDARAELIGLPVSHIRYYRNAQRGAFMMALGIFSQRVFCTFLERRSGVDRLSYDIAWV